MSSFSLFQNQSLFFHCGNLGLCPWLWSVSPFPQVLLTHLTLWSYRLLYTSQKNWNRKNKQVAKGACNCQWMVRTQCNYTIVCWWHLLFPESGSRVCTMVPVLLFYPQQDLDPCRRGTLLQAMLYVNMRGIFCFHLLESLES